MNYFALYDKKYMTGFTLIETVVIILILSIFIALSLPNYYLYQEKNALYQAKSALLQSSQKLQYTLINEQSLPEKLPKISNLIYNNDDIYTDKKYYQITYEKEDNSFSITATWQLERPNICHKILLFSSGYQSAYDIDNNLSNSCW